MRGAPTVPRAPRRPTPQGWPRPDPAPGRAEDEASDPGPGGRYPLIIVGLSHDTAPVAVREALGFPRGGLVETLAQLRSRAGLREAMVLSTCNRVEIYGCAATPGTDAIVAFLADHHGRRVAEIERYLYRLEGEHAVRHAFRVASSLDSMVLGEPQILGQVKEAYQAAEETGHLGPVLKALRDRSIAAARRIRTHTAIAGLAVSVSHVAVDLARAMWGDLRRRPVLLVGAGKMSELAARQMVREGARVAVLGGRSFATAERLAAALGGRAAPFAALRAELAKADVVVSGTGAPHPVIRRDDIEAAQRARGGRPLCLIDIAVPRDVAEGVERVDGVSLHDLDSIQRVAEANQRARGTETAAAEAILGEEAGELLAWWRSLEVVPLVVELRRRADAIRRDEVSKARRRLGPLTPRQENALEAATSAIVNKLLHAPTVHLKQIAGGGHRPQVDLVRDLFDL
jgi:glutamyl-tRNA reductase